VGFNILNYSSIDIPSDPPQPKFDISFINGIYFKRHYNENTLRLSVDQLTCNVKIHGNGSYEADTLITMGNWREQMFSMGFEQNYFEKKQFHLYWGVDLNLYYGIYSGQSQSLSGLSNFSTVKQNKGIGLTPLAGIRFTISNFLRISLETSGSSLFFTEFENKKWTLPMVKNEQNQAITFALKYNVGCKISYLF
jgi:hypothetical protein